MFESIGTLAAAQIGTDRPRAPTPVRRHSYAAGRERGVFWQATDRQTVRRIVAGARRYELATRQPGAQNGALGFVALEVLDFLANLVNYKTGQLDPALETMMRRLKRSKDAITRALKALRAHGFLDWLRRYVPTGNEGRGPQVQQTSNAYRLSMPPRALRLLGRYGQPAPAPDDFTAAQERRETGRADYMASLSPLEVLAESDLDPGLRAALEGLAQGVERESGSRSESRSIPLFYRD